MQQRIYKMSFVSVYPLYVKKAERKKRTQAEVDQIIFWLTGYNKAGLKKQLEDKVDFETFFAQAPHMNPNVSLITGVVCGVRLEEIKEPLMQKIRYLDKLIDELARGKKMEAILRLGSGAEFTSRTARFSGSSEKKETGGEMAKKKTSKKKTGLYANIRKAQERAKRGGKPVRKKGEKGAPTEKAFKKAKKTARKKRKK